MCHLPHLTHSRLLAWLRLIFVSSRAPSLSAHQCSSLTKQPGVLCGLTPLYLSSPIVKRNLDLIVTPIMVRSIIVCPEAYQTMLLHAFTHEREEIGGVLVGENDGPETSVITVIPLPRTSEQSDRVEISEAELAGCIDKCEELSKDLETPVSVVGWYHSHPHITPFPSHVDLQTQLNFQAMDRNFVGLIFSVFVHQPNSPGQVVSLLGFRSPDGKTEERIKVRIQPLLKSSANFYQVSSRLWRSVSDCIQNEFISKAEVTIADDLRLFRLFLQEYLQRTLEAAHAITGPMNAFVRFMTLGLDLAGGTNESSVF
ncbi:hypothetical protein AAHC03_01217 [Spirometra sp. Aus1]